MFIAFLELHRSPKAAAEPESLISESLVPNSTDKTFHEFARLSIAKSQWARNYVDYYTNKGKNFHTIIRALAFKWIRILWKCWQDRTPYNEDKYMQTLKTRGSIFATLHLQNNS